MSDIFKDPPPKWLERLAIFGGVITVLILTGMAMLGAAFLLATKDAHADDRLTRIQIALDAGELVPNSEVTGAPRTDDGEGNDN